MTSLPVQMMDDAAPVAPVPDPLAEECARLQNALAFWMPSVPPPGYPLHARIAADAYLLCGYDGNCDEPSAYEQGLIKFAAPIAQLIERWEERARKAFPTDAMLINRHVRELHEALATQAAPVDTKDDEYSQDRFHCHDCAHSWNAIDETECPRDECPNCGGDSTDVPTEGNTAAPVDTKPAERQSDDARHAARWRLLASCKNTPSISAFGIPFVGFEFHTQAQYSAWSNALMGGATLNAAMDAALTTQAAPTKPADHIRALLDEHQKLIDAGNDYAYFELARTRVTDWMAWITDKPARGEIGTAAYAQSRRVICQGQGATPDEACADALAVLQAKPAEPKP